MSTKSFYVYELWNPLNNKIFYVGKGTKAGNNFYRLKEHIKDTNYYIKGKLPKTHKFTIIRKIIKNNKVPEIKIVFETNNENEAFKKEMELIKFYGRSDIGTGILTNHTDGGDGMSGWKHTASHREKLRIDNPGGKAVAKPILGICPKNGTVIRFESSSDASKKLLGHSEGKANIHQCATKFKNRIAYAYYWRFENEYNKNENFKLLNKKRKGHPILQLDKNKNIIKQWDKLGDATKHFGCGISTIGWAIKHKKMTQGFYWKKL